MNVPNPGSKEAIEEGCTCPVMDNNNGQGVKINSDTPLFWQEENCPLHGIEAYMKGMCHN